MNATKYAQHQNPLCEVAWGASESECGHLVSIWIDGEEAPTSEQKELCSRPFAAGHALELP